MNAAQRRAQEQAVFDAYLANCPSRHVLERLSGKWVTLVICQLGDHDGPRRFSEIQRSVAGVSQKMLTQTLRSLEADGLVAREIYPTVPATVTYELTELGRSLLAAIQPLKTWSEAHYPDIEEARTRSAG